MKLLGFLIQTIAFIFFIAETAHFGWNLFPQSGEEVICDIVAGVAWTIGYFIYKSDKSKK